MMWLLVLSVLVSLANASSISRIVGGSDSNPGEFPHMVSIQWAPHGLMHHLCGGSILNELWVLTAAHCNMLTLEHEPMSVIVGAWDFRTPSAYQQTVGVQSFINHPHYPGGIGVPHNIALIQLNHKLIFNSWVHPVSLPPTSSYPLGSALFSGWGWTIDEPPFLFPDILQSVQVPLISLSQCYSAFIGLAVRAFRPCGRVGAPTVYIRVSAYVDWIRSVMY
uniref:Putative trypsin-like serine protease n=1 Tax=Lutzomyia longipalpis TaxID=7200 RepID=A0A1B0CH31_LUTLO